MQVATRLMPFVPGLAWHAMLRTEPEVRQGLKLMYDGRFRICLMSCLAPIKPPIRGTSQHRLGSGPHQLPQGETAASATWATIVPGNRIQLVPFNQFSWWNKYQFTPVWAASVGLIYFSDSFASSDDSVKLPGFFRVDAGVFAKSTKPGEPRSISKTCSTRAIGHRPTETTIFRQDSRRPFG